MDKPASPNLGILRAKTRSSCAQSRPKVTRNKGCYIVPLGLPLQTDENRNCAWQSCSRQYNFTTQREVVDGRAPEISICASALLDFPFHTLYSHSSLSAEVGPLFPSPAVALLSVPPAHSSSSYLGACLESTSHSLNLSL